MSYQNASFKREHRSDDLSHHRFMKMAAQVNAEFDKIDAILESCLSLNTDEGKDQLAA